MCIVFYRLWGNLQTTASGKLFNDDLSKALLSVSVDILHMWQW